MSHPLVTLWRMWLRFIILALHTAPFFLAALSSPVNMQYDTTGAHPLLCGHNEILSNLGEPPVTYATLCRSSNDPRDQDNMKRRRSNVSDAVEPHSTATSIRDSTNAEWAPIRIAVFTHDLEEDPRYCTAIGQTRPDFSGSMQRCNDKHDILTDEKRRTLVHAVLPQVVRMHAQRLKVRPLAADTSIVVHSMPGKYCSSFTVPTAHQTTGVSNADFIVYVAAGPAPASRNHIAWAATCQYYPDTPTVTRRPAVGVIYFNPRYLPTSIGETQDEIDRHGGNPWSSTDRIRRVAAHELLHSLGFSESVFKARGMLVVVPSLRGKKNVPVLNSSAVRAAAKRMYGIAKSDIFYGAELEDEGALGTRLSHWKRRTAKDELMAPVLGLARYSSLSLAALEDTGFYKVNYDKAEPVDLGATAGAKLFTEPCVTDGLSNNPTVFCDNLRPSLHGCTADRLSIGRCATTTYRSTLPQYAQYFPHSPFLGGSQPFTDYCPVIQSFTNTRCSDGSPGAMPGSLTGNNARCFNANNLLIKTILTQPASICARVRCINVSRTYELLVSGANKWISCGAGGTGVTAQPAVHSPQTFVKGGTIDCPPYDLVCYANPFAFSEEEKNISTQGSQNAAAAATYGSVASGLVAVWVFLGAWIS